MKKTLLLLGLAALTAPAALAQTTLRFAEISTGGGNSGATYNQDYVVLYNYGTSAVSTAGLYLQYASATGTFPTATGSNNQAIPTFTIQPGKYGVIALGTASTTNGVALPVSIDATMTGPLLGAANGKVALASNSTQVTSPTNANVLDFIGYGTANLFEGDAAAPAGSATTALRRLGSPAGAIDNNRNGADFESVTYTATVTPLPVELVSFTVSADGRSARLAWTTASETNNAGFTVEHQTGTDWTAVSPLIAGHGTTTERQSYAFTVTGLTAGRHTFRLRQVDTDGTVNVSAPTSVEIGVEGAGRVTLLGSRAVRVEATEAQAVRVSVVDVLGRVVFESPVEVSGTAEVSLPVLSSGAYVVRVVGGRFAETKTLVVR